MSIQLQPPVPLVTLVKTEPPTVIKNEPPEEISTDIKDIDIVYHPLSEDLIKSETVLEDILENEHLESVQTQALVVKTENSSFIKTENIIQRNKSEEISDGNVSKGTGQGVIEVSNLNGISVRCRKSKSLKKTDFAECYKTDDTIWKKVKEKIKVIEAPVIPVEAHEYTSLAKDRHVCNHCQYAFNRLDTLKRHVKRRHREVTTMYQCPYCPYKSKWKLHIINPHIIQKHKDAKDIQWFQCNLCEKKFKVKCHLTKHKKIHLKHKQMKDGLDLREKSVEAHEFTSLVNGKHVCNHCQHACNNLKYLKFHIRKMHREVTIMYQCPYCPYQSKWGLHSHFIQKHKDTKDIEWFQCNLCEKKFKVNSHLTKHKKIHLKHEQMKDGLDLREKRYGCNKCDFKTYTSRQLNNHKLSHLKPEEMHYFYCYHCSYKTNFKMSLKGHIFRVHFKNVTQGKRYGCNECGYETYSSSRFNNHKLTHLKSEEIQYFHCYHCSYKAKRKDTLKYHIFRHFKKEQIQFDCYICNFMTSKRESILKHIKKHSNVQNKSKINERS